MTTPTNPGRVAGLWYLLLIALGPLRLIYIPTKLFVHGDPSATVGNIAAHALLFRLGIVADLTGAVVLVLMTLAFYRLFEGVDRNLAVKVIIFGGVMPSLLYFVGVACDLSVLSIARGTSLLSGFEPAQRDTVAVLLLRLRDHQNTAATVLWGVWLFPLALLVYRSRFLPRFLGVWLFINGLAWLALSLTGIMWPQYYGTLYKVLQPAIFGEIALTLWLVIKGATPKTASSAAS